MTATEFSEAIAHVSKGLPAVDWRDVEADVTRMLADTDWFTDWTHRYRPGTRATSINYAVTWKWIHVANAHLTTTPAWAQPVGRATRAAYRQFAQSLGPRQQEALLVAPEEPLGRSETGAEMPPGSNQQGPDRQRWARIADLSSRCH